MPLSAADIARLMRALSSSERLRLVALCASQPVRVSDLAAALEESEPTVSRLAKELATCGALRRSRRGRAVEYVLAEADVPAGRIARLVLAQLGEGDALLRRARASLATRLAAGATSGGSARSTSAALPRSGRFGRALQVAFEAQLRECAPGLALVAGCEHAEAIDAVIAASRRCELLVSSVGERARLRRWLLEAGLEAQVHLDGAAGRVCGAARRADWMLLGLESVGGLPRLEAGLRRAALALAPGATLWIYANYEALERDDAGSSPAAALRRRLEQADLQPRSIQPLEADGRHVLLVHAMNASAAHTGRQTG